MSDKPANPFLKANVAPQITPQAPAADQSVPPIAPQAAPHPASQSPFAAQSPFATQASVATQAPVVNAPAAPIPPTSRTPASQPPQAAPAQAVPQVSHAAQPSTPAQQTGTPQPASVQRMTASDATALPAGTKRPSPFDFSNNGGGQSPASGGGGASGGAASGGGNRAQIQRYSALQFTGGVGAYYGIVIVNLLLSLLTLGLWGPWAKVRTLRFFYGHTEFLEEGFEFLATGKQLFVGRLIAFIALVALGFFELVPVVGPVISVLLFVLAVPFILNRSLRFKAHYLTWRDVRFDWQGGFGKAFVMFMLYPLLSILTLGLLQPIAARALRQHYVDNHAFGAANFHADLPLSAFYLALLKGLIFFLIMSILLIGPTGFAAYMTLANSGLFEVASKEEFYLILALLDQTQQAVIALPVLGFIFAAYMTSGFYFALVRHILVAHTRLAGGIRLRSSLSSLYFAYILFSNFILNILTIGFAHPYTVIRRYRYLTETIEVRPIADMRGFIDHQKRSGFSIFEEASEIEGLSLDI